MASPPESPIEEVVYELEHTRVPKPIPVALEDLCRQTKFTKQEIRVMYRGFKTVSVNSHALLRFLYTEAPITLKHPKFTLFSSYFMLHNN